MAVQKHSRIPENTHLSCYEIPYAFSDVHHNFNIGSQNGTEALASLACYTFQSL